MAADRVGQGHVILRFNIKGVSPVGPESGRIRQGHAIHNKVAVRTGSTVYTLERLKLIIKAASCNNEFKKTHTKIVFYLLVKMYLL